MEEKENPNLDEEVTVLEDMLSELNKVTQQVEELNDKVYTKNYLDQTKLHLDKTRNSLILGFILMFLFTSILLGVLLHRQNTGDEEDREAAKQSRRQIADCTVKPGVVLDDGFVNPGKCYAESADRTAEAISDLTVNLQEGVRQLLLIQAEAVAANQTLSDDVRNFARLQVLALRNFTPSKAAPSDP